MRLSQCQHLSKNTRRETSVLKESILIETEDTKMNQLIIIFNLGEHKDKHDKRKAFRAAIYNIKVAVYLL